MEATVGGVVLAAGAGRRFGMPKALATLDGTTLVARAVGVLRAADIDPVVVVVGAGRDAVTTEAVAAGGTVVPNDGWRTGMGSSLRAGLEGLPPAVSAAVVALVDQPGSSVEVVHRLVAAWEASSRPAAVASYRRVTMPPVVLARSTWSAVLAAVAPDAGARAWLGANPEQVVVVPCDDIADLRDVDTPDDLDRWGDPRP